MVRVDDRDPGAYPPVGDPIHLSTKANSADTESAIVALRDSAISSLRTGTAGVDDVLDSYARCLEIFASEWQRFAGRMLEAQLTEPLTLDRTPLGLIVEAVASLMDEAVRYESSDAVTSIGYFPTRIAALGLRYSGSAYLSALNLVIRFYYIALRRSDSAEAASAKGSWIYVRDFIRFRVRAYREGHEQGDEAVVIDASNMARRVLVDSYRAMFRTGDLDGFRDVLSALDEIRDE